MQNLKGALTIAEGDLKYKTDVSLAFGGTSVERRHILRTSLDTLGVWKAKYVKTNISPFDARLKTVFKEAAIIDQEVWVFGIDSTKSQDIVAAVGIACKWYKVTPDQILGDTYIKNLNVEHANDMGNEALVAANKKLYASVSCALVEAARSLNVTGELNLWVISSSRNHKIPEKDLHDSLRAGGAESVDVDPTPYNFYSGSNNGLFKARIDTNLHLAKFKL